MKRIFADKFPRPAAALLLMAAGALAVFAVSAVDRDAAVALVLPDSARAAAATALADAPRSYADLAALVMPGVVNISTDKVVEMPDWHPMMNDPMFRRFFGDPESPDQQEQIERSLGSGVIISADGYILTSNHVIERASKIRVLFGDSKELEAKIVGQDERTDVALIKVETDEALPFLRIGDSDALRIGDQVMAVGNPFGVGQTVTLGIVSAVGRSIGLIDYEDFIQTDASINPGNSGGALVDMNGALVGINTAILSRSGGSQGVGFAIPSNMAVTIKDMLVKHGKVQRAWLGVITAEVDQTMAEALGMKAPRGVLISTVNEGTPAAKAGMQENDVILQVDGQPVNSVSDLRNTISLSGVGHDAKLLVLRDGRERQLTVTLGELPEDPTAAAAPKDEGEGADGIEGVTVRELNAPLRQRLRLAEGVEGVVVAEVAQTSNASHRGLRQGDVIVEVAREPVATLDDYRRLVKKDADRPVLLKIRRGDQFQVLAVPR
ncbi:MAG: DegQ family serine endoprotease [bacterium]|nr:DegQ family serine endoprotease [bacterium]